MSHSIEVPFMFIMELLSSATLTPNFLKLLAHTEHIQDIIFFTYLSYNVLISNFCNLYILEIVTTFMKFVSIETCYVVTMFNLIIHIF